MPHSDFCYSFGKTDAMDVLGSVGIVPGAV
jgi:hypothetical protein